MRALSLFFTSAFVLSTLCAVGLADHHAEDKEKEKLGIFEYSGTGEVDAASETGQMSVIFNVRCQKSAQDVHDAITGVSGSALDLNGSPSGPRRHYQCMRQCAATSTVDQTASRRR